MKKTYSILGAGPAGLSAAINLAKAGYKVEVFEKNKFCGARFNGDFQALENWSRPVDVIDELKSMNISMNFEFTPRNALDVYDPNLVKRCFASEKPFYYLIRRGNVHGSLDKGLFAQAKNLGVKFRFDSAANPIDCDIISSGPTSADAIAKGITFETKINDITIGLLDDDVAPKGYAYLFTVNGKGCMVTVMFRHFKYEQAYYEKMMERFKKIANIDMKNINEFGGYGNFFLESVYKYNGKLHIGEAAGLQDFLFGFGMRHALTSGYLAAKSIINGEDFEALMRERFKKQTETGIMNRFIFEKLGNFGYKLLLSRLDGKIDPVKYLNKIYNGSELVNFFLPIAEISMKSKANLHKDCYCTWCRSREQLIN